MLVTAGCGGQELGEAHVWLRRHQRLVEHQVQHCLQRWGRLYQQLEVQLGPDTRSGTEGGRVGMRGAARLRARRLRPDAVAVAGAALLLMVGCARAAAVRHAPSSATSSPAVASGGVSSTQPSGRGVTRRTGTSGAPTGVPSGKTIPKTGASPLSLTEGLVLAAMGAGVTATGWRRLRRPR